MQQLKRELERDHETATDASTTDDRAGVDPADPMRQLAECLACGVQVDVPHACEGTPYCVGCETYMTLL